MRSRTKKFFNIIIVLVVLMTISVLSQTPTLEDKKKQGDAIFNEAFALFDEGTDESYLAALEKFQQVNRIYEEIGDKSENAGKSWLASGVISNILGRNDDALRFYDRALKLFQQIKNKFWEATTFERIGLAYSALGEKQKALEMFIQALSLTRQVGDKDREGTILYGIGLTYSALSEKQKALGFLNQALSLKRQVGDKSGEATILNAIGVIYSALGESQKALEFYNQGLLLRREVGDEGGAATALTNIGSVYSDLGENQKALEFYSQALPIMRQVGDKRGEARILNAIGLVYSDLDENQKALEYYNQGLLISREIEDKKGVAITLNNIGKVYSDLGENQKALEFYNQALLILLQIDDKSGAATTLNNIGKVFSDLGESQKALEFYLQALELSREVEDKSGEATTLTNIGRVLSDSGENQKALEIFNLALEIIRQVGDKSREATILTAIGAVYSDLGESQKALEFYYQALPLKRLVGNKSGEAGILSNVKSVWNTLKNRQLAIFYGKQSVNLYQELRQNNQGLDKETQKTYLRLIEPIYRRLAEILITNNRLVEAQQVLNSFKDQQFFDFDQTQIKQPVPLALTPREKDFFERYEKSSSALGTVGSRLDELKRQIGNRQPTADETAQLRKLEGEIKTATDTFLGVLKQAEDEFSKPTDEKDKVGEIPDLREMQTALRLLNQQTGQKAVAVYQLVGEENFSALLITPDGIEKVSVPAKNKDLDEKAQNLWGLLQSDRYDTTVLSKKIYEIVFQPLEEKLPKDTTTIMWSLDSKLRYLPMAALWDGKQFLAERYNHVVFTRADSERMTRNVSKVWTGTGFGSSKEAKVEVLGSPVSFSPLPGVSEELSAIFKNSKGGIIEGTTFPDAQFNRENFLKALKTKRPLAHIASHFSFRPGDEARSFLLMGDGTAFTLEEMKREANLFQGVELLTLSACNTAAIQLGNGREIDGFAELAQRLGAGAVMATLWQVSDASTPWLMREFYANRQSKNGMTKTEALRTAQLALLKGTAETKPLPQNEKSNAENKVQIVIIPKGGSRSEKTTRSDVIYLDEEEAPLYKKEGKAKFSHPYFWSPFILIGNWK